MKTLCAIIPAAIIGSFKKDHVPDDFSALGHVTCQGTKTRERKARPNSRRTMEGTPIRLKADEGSKQRSRERCKARTKAGDPCRAPSVERGLCFFHAHPEKLPELGRQGGQKNRRWTSDGCELPTIPLKSIDDVLGLLEETINRIRQGPFDLRVANSIGFLVWIHLKALAQRVEAPETRCGEESVYMSLFQRLGSDAPDQEVSDLYPQPQEQDQTSAPASLLSPSERVNDPSSHSHDPSEIITVEVG